MRTPDSSFISFTGGPILIVIQVIICVTFLYIFSLFFYCLQAKSKGIHTKSDIGVKYAEKQQRRFAPEKLKEGRNIIGLQVSLRFCLYKIFKGFKL